MQVICRRSVPFRFPLSLRERAGVRECRRAEAGAVTRRPRTLTLPSPKGRGFRQGNGGSLIVRREKLIPRYGVAPPHLALQLPRVQHPDAPVEHHTAGNGAGLGNLEQVPHLGRSQPHFFQRRLQQSGHGLLDLVGHVVNHRMVADIHLLALGNFRGVAIGTNVEADDDGV